MPKAIICYDIKGTKCQKSSRLFLILGGDPSGLG